MRNESMIIVWNWNGVCVWDLPFIKAVIIVKNFSLVSNLGMQLGALSCPNHTGCIMMHVF